MPLRSLLGHCTPDAGGGSACSLTGDQRVVLGHDAVLGGLGYCTFECGSPGNYVAGSVLGATILGGVMLYTLVDALGRMH